MKRAVLMSSLALAAAIIVLPACHLLSDKGADTTGKDAGAPAGGPPPLPPYQMRAQVDDADRLHPTSEGEALFSNHCGACHLAAGMGTNLITARQAAAGQKQPVGLLANRTDITADYVKAVVRSGKGAMPRQTRVDVTDAELDKIAAFLGKGK
jgi:mono/diheme cytochrome c family protein